MSWLMGDRIIPRDSEFGRRHYAVNRQAILGRPLGPGGSGARLLGFCFCPYAVRRFAQGERTRSAGMRPNLIRSSIAGLTG